MEVIDLTSIKPLDRETIINSVKKTGAILAVDEDYSSYGVAFKAISIISENTFKSLKKAPENLHARIYLFHIPGRCNIMHFQI
ncbi:MAG: transketolase C-terminal domain-containing protein [Ferroplasma sp.]